MVVRLVVVAGLIADKVAHHHLLVVLLQVVVVAVTKETVETLEVQVAVAVTLVALAALV
jgi:hypothetical protein